MKDIMVDIETLGNTSYAPIAQIGACYFDPLTGKIGDVYNHFINVQTCVDIGMNIDLGTVLWWLKQDKEAINSVFMVRNVHIRQALVEFADFCMDANRIWSHATFDFVIIMNHFKKASVRHGIRFWEAKDIRTLFYIHKLTTGEEYKLPKRTGIHHNAFDDAKYQAKYVSEMIQNIKAGGVNKDIPL